MKVIDLLSSSALCRASYLRHALSFNYLPLATIPKAKRSTMRPKLLKWGTKIYVQNRLEPSSCILQFAIGCNDFFRITIYFDPEIGCWVKTPESHQCPIFVTRSASITCCYQNLSTVQYDQKYNHLFWSRDWRKTPVSILLSFLSSSCPRLQLLATSYQQQLPYQKQHFVFETQLFWHFRFLYYGWCCGYDSI